ncbi:hypothetical protein ACF0H5_013545 [Mactra antiquata]
MDQLLLLDESSSVSNVSYGHNVTYSETSNVTVTTNAPSSSGRGGASLQTIMSKELSDDIVEVLQCYIFPIITLIGVIGSILSLIVLFQKNLRNSTTSIVLIGLAFSDLAFLVTNMIRKSSCIIRSHDANLANEINATTFFYMFYLKTSFSRVSTLIVLLISVERLVAVAFPLSVKTVVTKGRMIASVVLCYVITFGMLAVLPPQYTYKYIRGKAYIWQTKFALENAKSLKVYNEYFLPITFRYIPVLVVLGINIVIVYLIKGSKRFRESSTKQDPRKKDEQRKITRMLLVVSLIYLICLLPGNILLFCSSVIDGFQFFGTYRNLFNVLSDLCLLFEIINSSVNFIIYMFLNRNFYETYVGLFCCKGRIRTYSNKKEAYKDKTGSSDGTQSTDPSRSTTESTCKESKSQNEYINSAFVE